METDPASKKMKDEKLQQSKTSDVCAVMRKQ